MARPGAAGAGGSDVDPNGRYRYYTYDANGNSLSYTNRRGQAVSFTYDALNRPLTRTADGAQTTYGYGSGGSWTSAQNAESTDTVYLNVRGEVSSEVAIRNGIRTAVVSHYLDQGPRDSAAVNFKSTPAFNDMRFGYDYGLRLTSISGLGLASTSITYNPDGLPTKVTLPGGVYESFAYTPSHMRSQNGWSAGAANSQLGASYSYDQLDRMTGRTNVYGDTARNFAYDALSQLAGETDQDSYDEFICPDMYPADCYWQTFTETYAQRSYGYDAVGNRTDSGAALESSSNRYSIFNGYSFAYDADGNPTQKSGNGATVTYQWNSLGQLTGVNPGSGWIYYGYNGFGERVRRSAPDGSVIRYFYDGDNLALETDGSGNALRDYLYYPGTDQPFALRAWTGGTSATYYYSMDVPGNVTGLLTASGSVPDQYAYDPWGAPLAGFPIESVPQPLRYMAREIDSATGLYYVRNRWYDPTIGRFLSEDPIGIDGGINNYAYAANSPVNARDPSGLWTILWGCVGDVPDNSTDGCAIIAVNWQALLTSVTSGGGGASPSFGYADDYTGMGAGDPSDGMPASGGGAPTGVFSTISNWYKANSECINSALAATASVAGDVALLTGVGAAAKAGGVALKLGLEGVAADLRFADKAAQVAYKVAGVFSREGMSEAGDAATEAARGVNDTAYLGVGSGATLSVWDFVPFVASYRAGKDAIQACF